MSRRRAEMDTDPAYAVTQYRAEQGDADAQFELGRAHWFGFGVPQDDAEAVAWYRRAATQGNATAQSALGSAYWLGRGVPQDSAEAVGWYRRAAKQGDANAQALIGAFYAEGQGVPQDDAEAAVWYRRAAEQGDDKAQYQLGDAYWHGRGVPQDYSEAHLWFNLAAAQGNRRARENRDKVARLMTRTQIGEAQRHARQWAANDGRIEPEIDQPVGSFDVSAESEDVEDLDESVDDLGNTGGIYARANAISEGGLIDITKTAAEYGFRGAVAITLGAWTEAVAWSADDERRRPALGQSETERLHDVLAVARRIMRQAQAAGRIRQPLHYDVTVLTRSGRPWRKRVSLKMLVHRGDAGKDVATIMLVDEGQLGGRLSDIW